ncbi:hypothetical protein B0H14DRAFT_2586812 [Mycena olivaceomarginata]|nr:hypothetical protein B0H14DRAFT_2586812 [Mycena olivaceomarginata]
MLFTPGFHLLLALAGSAVATLPTQILYQSPTGLFLENIAVRPSTGKLLLTSVLSPTLHTFCPKRNPGRGVYLPQRHRPHRYRRVSPGRLRRHRLRAQRQHDPRCTGQRRPLERRPYLRRSRSQNRCSYTTEHAHQRALRRPDIVLATDSALGAAYEVDMRTSAVRVLIKDAALALGAPPPVFGMNGLHPHGGSLYFTNSALDTFGRVPLGGGGGAPEVLVVASSGYDDFALDAQGRANGTWVQETAVGDVAGSTVLQRPTAAAFGRCGGKEKILYATTAAGQMVALDTSGVEN